jgi:taurine--2-oxoglutarate transaminase
MFSKEEIKRLDRKHVVHSWSVQDEVNPIVVEKCQGVYFWDIDGNKYLDFSSALVNLNIGYQHPKVINAIKEQAEKYCYLRPDCACSIRSEYARDLSEITPGDLNRFFFTLAGADANENAVKIGRAFTGKFKILTKYRSYHGATYGAISLSGDPRRIPVEPGIPGVVHFFDPYCYRCSYGLTYPSCNLRCVEQIDEIIRYESAQSVAAVLVETQTGANGFFAPPDGYFQRLREICNKHSVLLILDEVMVAFGRTGKWFAIDHYGVVPDMITLAKGLTCGYVPLGAVAISDRIMNKLSKEMLYIGLTYSSHPLALATAKAVLDVYKEEKLVENAQKQERLVRNKLLEIKEKHRSVGDVRGMGLFFCVELVKNRETKEPLDARYSKEIRQKLMQKGLSTNVIGNLVFIGPPLIIGEDQLRDGLKTIDEVLEYSDGLAC